MKQNKTRIVSRILFLFGITLSLLAAATPEMAEADVRFLDQQGSEAGTFIGKWKFIVDTGGSDYLGVRVPDPTWGWTRPTDRTEFNTQDISTFQMLSIPAPSFVEEYGDHYGFHWLYYYDPPETIVVEVVIGGTAGVDLHGLTPHDTREPGNDWCVGTPNIHPGQLQDVAAAIHADLDSQSLCGSEGMIQAAIAWAQSRHPGPDDCQLVACAAAGVLRAWGIPASYDLTYQIAHSAQLGGLSIDAAGGFHAQISAWNWATGEWERCHYPMTNAVLPNDILAGRFLDPEYINPRVAADGAGGIESVYVTGSFGGSGMFSLFQERRDDILGIDLSLGTLCFASFKCNKIDTMGTGGLDPMTSVAAPDRCGFSGRAGLTVPSPSRGKIRFRTEAPVRMEVRIFDLSGRLVERMTGRGEVESRRLSTGVYFYRVSHSDREVTGRTVVLR